MNNAKVSVFLISSVLLLISIKTSNAHTSFNETCLIKVFASLQCQSHDIARNLLNTQIEFLLLYLSNKFPDISSPLWITRVE